MQADERFGGESRDTRPADWDSLALSEVHDAKWIVRYVSLMSDVKSPSPIISYYVREYRVESSSG